MRTLARSASLLLFFVAIGCGTAITAPENDAATPTVDAATPLADTSTPVVDAAMPVDAYVRREDANVPVTTTSLVTGPYHVAPGVEQTLCITLDLGNDQPMMLRAVRTHLTDGSHHLVVSRADGYPVDPTPTPCAPLTHGIGQSIFIAESHESELVYPPGTGLPMAPHQVIGLELHMIDVTPTAIDIQGSVDFDLVPADPSLREVHILFTGNGSLSLPPHQATTVRGLFALPDGSEILAMTTHTHQLGTSATLDITSSDGDPGRRVFENLDWSDPPLEVFDPPLVLAPGEQVRLTCNYFNNTDDTVTFGTGFYDEMCFFWAYYVGGA
ncbi:MAG: hypothetical protein U0234_10165 [Sandaracinus sp.]